MREHDAGGETRKPTAHRGVRRLLIGVTALLAAAAFAAVVWIATPYPPHDEAFRALSSSATLEFADTGDALVFRPVEPARGGLVFYPGGRVDFRAYAPLARRIAEYGYLVAIPKMPLGLAVLDADAAARIIAAEPEVASWSVGGHSLGGAMAARFAQENIRDVDCLVLLAAYPPSSTDLSASGIRVLSIRGTEDGLISPLEIDESRARLPRDSRFVVVPGGNHAGFGSYGPQRGDGTATLPAAAQQAAAAFETARLLAETIR